MEIERLRKIIAYSDKNHEEIKSMVRRFCSFAGIEYDSELLNILQIVRSSFQKKGYLVFEMPIADDEIGALCYRGDGIGYVVLNTTLPRVNVNFAIAHEIYHVFFGMDEYIPRVEFASDHYYDHEEEFAANLFAGMLLMPEVSFRRMYITFREESYGDETETIIRLMSYYQVPFMAALIRCLELNLIARDAVQESFFTIDRDKIKNRLADMWLDEGIMEPSRRDDYIHIEAVVKVFGNKFIEDQYMKERTLRKALSNMRELYVMIKGE